MPVPDIGVAYRYVAESGLAARHVDGELSAEMHALDLHPDTVVAVAGWDDDRGLVLVEWTDAHGTPRVTSVEPAVFAEHFVRE
jgi:hypothetical protein